ncbi:MAG: aminotransferase class V-fold PLP-dependent enzyme [Bacteroidetes bacterium]|nr:MAG: aminotransferase class V-fold PLP-dependent enzyme [Bacteroidota bacterium]TAG90422.1 MAG: aminotransferase class V-fold PLP-dependent enzyme [Bacteroidota bacterium]
MIYNFYPGPSKLHTSVPIWITKALESGIISRNHRSQVFMDLYQEVVKNLQIKLNIPNDYSIYFVSSATECWEIITQSFANLPTIHFYTGSFGEKWAKNAQKKQQNFSVFNQNFCKNSLLCVTPNETSNGSIFELEILDTFKKLYPKMLIACDVTSGLAGVNYDLKKGDIWFASVQKCFGLPSGLALMIVSPKAIEEAKKINQKNHYNDLLQLETNFLTFQTPFTPNILNIFLLNEWAKQTLPIDKIAEKLKQRTKNAYQWIEKLKKAKPLIKNKEKRSDTVWAIETDKHTLVALHQEALKQNIILGNGYGEWKSTSFRIANFPQIEDNEIVFLQDFLEINLT